MFGKKLFAFLKPINYFLDMPFDVPVNVYSKESFCFSAVNQYQLNDLNVTRLQDVKGMSMHDVFLGRDEAQRIIQNDMEVMKKKGTIFLPKMPLFLKRKNTSYIFLLKQFYAIQAIM